MNKYFQIIIFIIVILLLFIFLFFYINKSNNSENTITQTSTISATENIEYTTTFKTSTLMENITKSTSAFRYNITILDFKINVENVYFNNETKTYEVKLNWTIYVKSNTNYTYPVTFYEYETAESEGALTVMIEEKVYPNKITKIESNIHKLIFKGSKEDLYSGIKVFKIIIAYPPPYEPGKGKARLIYYNLSGKFFVYIP